VHAPRFPGLQGLGEPLHSWGRAVGASLHDPRDAVCRAVWQWRAEAQGDRRAPLLRPLLTMLAVTAAFGALACWRGHAVAAASCAAFAVLNLGLAVLRPPAFHRHAAFWSKAGGAAGTFASALTLGLLYFLVFTPAAVALRLVRQDPLKLRFLGAEASYWQEAERQPDCEADYRRQF